MKNTTTATATATTIETINAAALAALAAQAEKLTLEGGFEKYDAIDAARAALRKECPSVIEAANAVSGGKKAVVTAAVAAAIDLRDPEIAQALANIATAKGWRAAQKDLALLPPLARGLLTAPTFWGLILPCSPHACPGVGTNWGLPNVQEVARRLSAGVPASRHPYFPKSGRGWKFIG
jgi:hypothetical protein